MRLQPPPGAQGIAGGVGGGTSPPLTQPLAPERLHYAATINATTGEGDEGGVGVGGAGECTQQYGLLQLVTVPFELLNEHLCMHQVQYPVTVCCDTVVLCLGASTQNGGCLNTPLCQPFW